MVCDTGHVLIIDHGDDIISVYKHNSKVLKTQNNFVKAGESLLILEIKEHSVPDLTFLSFNEKWNPH